MTGGTAAGITGAAIGGRRRTAFSNLQFAILMASPVILFLFLVVAYPLGYALWMSLHDIIFFGGYRAVPVGADHYLAVFDDPVFWRALGVSVRFTVMSVVLTLAIGLGLGLIVSRQFPGAALVRTLIILPWGCSLYGTGIMFSQLSRGQTGLLTWLSYALGFDEPVNLITEAWVVEILALGNAWNLAPLVGFFLGASIAAIPRRLYDMAVIDRLGPMARFVHVTLPPIHFSLFVFTAISTVLSLKLLDYIIVFTRGGPGAASSTLTYELYEISFIDLNLGYGAAMSFLLLVLIIGSTLLLYALWGRRAEKI